jgi:hypothetical protein
MPIILDAVTPTSGGGALPTLGAYRQRLAETAGYNIQVETTAGAGRSDQLVCSAFQSTELETSFFGNTWMYQPTGPNAGQCRRIQYQGLDSASGTITLERALPSATPINTPLEIYGRLPPVKYEGRLGLNDLVNRVLHECWTIQKLPLPGVLNQRLYPIGSSFPWLQSEDQIVEVLYLPANSDPNADDQLMVNWRWVPGGDNPGIEVAQTLNAGDVLKIQAYVPMSWWTNTSGTGFALATTEGLFNDSDQALLPILGMEIVGNAWVYNELAKWGLPDDQATYRQLHAQARAAANQWKRLTLMHPQVRKQHWPSSLTVRSKDNYGYGYGVLTPG